MMLMFSWLSSMTLRRLDALESCQATLLLATEVLEDGCMADLIPINSLRNAALLAAQTPLVFIGDGMLPVHLLFRRGNMAKPLKQHVQPCKHM